MMHVTKIEKLVLGRMLADPELRLAKSAVNIDAVVVLDRELTGAGFLTEFGRSEELRVSDTGASFRWGKVGARLNASKLETGYLVYVDDGYITTMEGYTYGDAWPTEVREIELYDLKPSGHL